MPIARDYSTLSYSSGVSVSTAGSYCNPGQQQQQQAALSLERPGSTRNPHSSDGGPAGSRISSASSSDNGGGANTAGGAQANPLLSPCSVMEEASSPGSTTSQLSYLGALQSPATSLTPLGFPAPYLLTKDGAGLAAAAAAAAQAAHAAHAAQQVGHVGHTGHVSSGGIGGPKQKKEPKPGSDVRSFGCQVQTPGIPLVFPCSVRCTTPVMVDLVRFFSSSFTFVFFVSLFCPFVTFASEFSLSTHWKN